MTATDELREWFKDRMFMTSEWQEIRDIADRIDARHEKECAESWMRGHDVWAAIGNEDVMAERGWVRLPVDADGVPIRVGDALDGYGKTIEVVEMRYGRSGWVLISRDGNGYADTFAFAHHRAQTVEDVLREFTDAILEWSGKSGSVAEVGTWSDIAAQYAAKLRMAGDAE